MRKISIVTGCYNEEENIPLLYEQIIETMRSMSDYYCYEIIISRDKTSQILKALEAKCPNFKVIFNSRNFGPDRSGYNATAHL